MLVRLSAFPGVPVARTGGELVYGSCSWRSIFRAYARVGGRASRDATSLSRRKYNRGRGEAVCAAAANERLNPIRFH